MDPLVELAPDPASLPTEVQRVRELDMIIGTRIKYDGEDSIRLDTRTEGVQGGLGEGDGDTPDTLVCEGTGDSLQFSLAYQTISSAARGGRNVRTTDSQDGLAIGHDDQVDQTRRIRPLGESREIRLFL